MSETSKPHSELVNQVRNALWSRPAYRSKRPPGVNDPSIAAFESLVEQLEALVGIIENSGDPVLIDMARAHTSSPASERP